MCASPTRRTPSAARTAAESYLVVDKILDAARQAGADAIHPGYGFLSENAEFAQAVIDAGLTWIGPPPAAIRSLGDKVSARHIAQRAGAPAGARHRRPGHRGRRGRHLRPGARPPGRHQGRLRRWWPRAQGGPHPRGDPGAVRLGRPRGGRRVRPGRVLRRALPRQPAARRDPVPRRHGGQRGRRVHPRLLPAAPPPEARRGGARALPQRGPGRAAVLRIQGDPQGGRLRQCRHLRVPRRRSTAPSPSSRSTPASRSSTPSPRRWPASISSASSSGSPTAA